MRGEDISCGWTILPLYTNATSVCLPNADATMDLHINGGTPLEHNVFLSQTTKRSSIKRFLLGNFVTVLISRTQAYFSISNILSLFGVLDPLFIIE